MVAQFKSKLVLDDNDGSFVVAAPLLYDSALLERTITVPAEFPTDLASIPRVLWNVLPPIGKYDRAAVIHDFLYKHNGVTRAQADAVLNEAMEVCGVSTFTRWTIYSGVRIGGWKPWNAYRAQDST